MHRSPDKTLTSHFEKGVSCLFEAPITPVITHACCRLCCSGGHALETEDEILGE